MSVRLEWTEVEYAAPATFRQGFTLADGNTVSKDYALVVGSQVVEGTAEGLYALLSAAKAALDDLRPAAAVAAPSGSEGLAGGLRARLAELVAGAGPNEPLGDGLYVVLAPDVNDDGAIAAFVDETLADELAECLGLGKATVTYEPAYDNDADLLRELIYQYVQDEGDEDDATDV